MTNDGVSLSLSGKVAVVSDGSRGIGALLLMVVLLGTAYGHPFADERRTSRVKVSPDAECTDEARRDKVKGTVVLFATVDTDGKVKEVHVVRSLRPDLDKQAVAAVKTWEFEPAKKSGQPVMVKVSIEVNFDCTR